ncbi:response regulator [Salinicola halimionae]|uniref:response regulator n=1 Tax=Salinicola halimionae TaxID=1949081 RepID=UPI000DA12A00|nr:response regulator [Salinicola halimionae]
MASRWLILLSVLSSTLLLGFIGWHAWEWHHANDQMLSRRLQSINRVFTPSLAEAAQNEEMSKVHELLIRLTSDPAIINATLRDESGSVRDFTGSIPPPPPLNVLPSIRHTWHQDGIQRWIQPLEEFSSTRSPHRYWLDLSLDPRRATTTSESLFNGWTPLLALLLASLLASPAALAWRQSRRADGTGRHRERIDDGASRPTPTRSAPPLQAAVPDTDLSYVSHELRAPLSGVLGFCRLLENSPLDAQQREWLRHIHLASNGLLDTVDHVLGDTRRCRPDNVFDIAEVLWEVLCLQTPVAQSKRITLLAIVYDDVPPRLLGADIGIRQLLTNLINNAIKYGDAGDVVVRVVLESRDGNVVRLRLSVSDGGSPDPSHRERLLQSIERGRMQPGEAEAGLGIGICHRLVADMNGTLTLGARPGRGHTIVANIGLEACKPYVRPAEFDLEGVEIALWQPHTRLAYLLDYALKRWHARPTSLSEPDFLNALDDTSQLSIIGIDDDAHEPDAHRAWQRRFNALRHPCLLIANIAPTRQITWHLPRGSVVLRLPISRYILGRTLAKMLAESRQRTLPPRPRILVVDDDEISQHYLDALLPILGADVVVAGSAAEALAIAEDATIDLVLMDQHLPDTSGFVATQRLRRLSGEWEHKPIIAMTAESSAYRRHLVDSGNSDDGNAENERDLEGSGVNEMLIKPLDERLLRDVLARHLPIAATSGVMSRPPLQPPLSEPAILESISPEQVSSPETHSPEAGSSWHSADLPVVDKAEGQRLSGNRETLAEEMMAMLVTELPGYREALQVSWQRHDAEQLVEIAHQLGGGCRYCGVPQLSAACETLESRVRLYPLHDCDEAFRELIAACDRLIVWADDQMITASR